MIARFKSVWDPHHGFPFAQCFSLISPVTSGGLLQMRLSCSTGQSLVSSSSAFLSLARSLRVNSHRMSQDHRWQVMAGGRCHGWCHILAGWSCYYIYIYCMYICIYVIVYIYIYIQHTMYIYIYIVMYVHIYIYVYIYIHIQYIRLWWWSKINVTLFYMGLKAPNKHCEWTSSLGWIASLAEAGRKSSLWSWSLKILKMELCTKLISNGQTRTFQRKETWVPDPSTYMYTWW